MFQWQPVGLPKISGGEVGIPLETQGTPYVLHGVVPAHQGSLTEALETRRPFKIDPIEQEIGDDNMDHKNLLLPQHLV